MWLEALEDPSVSEIWVMIILSNYCFWSEEWTEWTFRYFLIDVCTFTTKRNVLYDLIINDVQFKGLFRTKMN